MTTTLWGKFLRASFWAKLVLKSSHLLTNMHNHRFLKILFINRHIKMDQEISILIKWSVDSSITIWFGCPTHVVHNTAELEQTGVNILKY